MITSGLSTEVSVGVAAAENSKSQLPVQSAGNTVSKELVTETVRVSVMAPDC